MGSELGWVGLGCVGSVGATLLGPHWGWVGLGRMGCSVLGRVGPPCRVGRVGQGWVGARPSGLFAALERSC